MGGAGAWSLVVRGAQHPQSTVRPCEREREVGHFIHLLGHR